MTVNINVLMDSKVSTLGNQAPTIDDLVRISSRARNPGAALFAGYPRGMETAAGRHGRARREAPQPKCNHLVGG